MVAEGAQKIGAAGGSNEELTEELYSDAENL